MTQVNINGIGKCAGTTIGAIWFLSLCDKEGSGQWLGRKRGTGPRVLEHRSESLFGKRQASAIASTGPERLTIRQAITGVVIHSACQY